MLTSRSKRAPWSVPSDRQSSSAASHSFSLRAMRATREILESDLVGGDHAGSGSGLDGHVADGHPSLHRESADRGPPVLDDMAGAAASTDGPDDRQNQVLGAHTGREFAFDVAGHSAGALLRQGLGGKHLLDLAGADAEGERPKRPMGGRMAVTAHDRHAWLREPELGADDVHDSLVLIAHRKETDPELGAVLGQDLHLAAGDGILDGPLKRCGGDVVIHRRDCQLGSAHAPAGESQSVEGLR